ncbi:MAG: TIR domain-containing protein [Candidatus Aminicenantes bacterium]
MKYKAFISYNHEDSTMHAREVEKALKKYAKPMFGRPVKIFRDETYMVPGIDLPQAIKKALEESEYLIYFASKKAAESPWVQDEIKYWCEFLKRTEKLIIIAIKDNIALNLKDKKIAWEATDALPKLLQDYLNSIPLYLELQWANRREDFDLNNARFKAIIRNITALFRGIVPDEMDGEEVKIYNKNKRIRIAALSILITLTIAALGSAWYALKKQREAEEQKRLVEVEKTKAISAKNEALIQKKIAEQEKGKAINSKNEAVKQQKIAEEQRQWAIQSLREANYNIALTLKEKAKSFSKEKKWQLVKLFSVNSLLYHLKAQKFSPLSDIQLPGIMQNWILKYKIPFEKYTHLISGSALSVNFSPDGTMLAWASGDHFVNLLDLSTGKIIYVKAPDKSDVFFPTFSPDSKLLAFKVDDGINLWDISTGKVIKKLKNPGDSTSICFSPDGKYLASGNWKKTVTLWKISNSVEITTFKAHELPVTSVDISPDGKLLATGSWDNKVKLWDISNASEIKIFKGHSHCVSSVNFSPDGKTLASGGLDYKVILWEVPGGKIIDSIILSNNYVYSVRFSPGGNILAFAGGDRNIYLWDIPGKILCAALLGHSDDIQSISFSSNEKYLASASKDKTINLWENSNGKIIRKLNGRSSVLSFSPDGKILATSSSDNTIKLRDLATGNTIKTLTGHTGSVRTISFSYDGKFLASGSSDNTIRLWDVSKGGQIAVFPGYGDSGLAMTGVDLISGKVSSGSIAGVTSVHFSPDGRYLASTGMGGGIKLWDLWKDLLGNKPIVTLKGGGCLSFSPDGKFLAFESDGKIKLWEFSSSKTHVILEGHKKSKVSAISISPDLKLLASGGWDRTVKLWDISTGKLIKTLKEHNDKRVSAVSFSADGKVLATADWSYTVKLWDISSGKVIDTINYHGPTIGIFPASFSPVGRLLATGSRDNAVNIIDTSYLWLGLEFPYKIEDVEKLLKRVERETGYRLEGINPVPIDPKHLMFKK